MKTILRPAIVLFSVLTLICCVIYPYAVTCVGQLVFPEQANGSFVMRGGQPVGSSLIGQAFTSPKYFWGRPSATGPMPDNAASSGGSNLGPANPALADAVKSRVEGLKAADPGNTLPVPVDLVTSSASGLDPDISLAGAYYQAARVARQRNLPLDVVRDLIWKHAQKQYFGFFGEPRVNVLVLNLALDGLPA